MSRESRRRYVLLVGGINLCLFSGFLFNGNSSKTVPEPDTFQGKTTYVIKQKISSDLKDLNTIAPITANVCSGNESRTIVVNITKQHLWACQDNNIVFVTPVTTAATASGSYTPTGSFAVESKQANRYLNGSDSQGSWHDFVNFWMPFYGEYGFHDATWQTIPFGDLNSYTTEGSHGCVRLPLGAMGLLYNWSTIGTSVVIEY